MKTKILTLAAVFFVSLFVAAAQPVQQHPEQEIFDRIGYVYDLKLVIERDWPGFSSEKFDVPLVYYTDSVCYVANPTEALLAIRRATPVHRSGDVTIYKTALLDNVPFHMSVSITTGDPDSTESDFTYRSPYMLCSSFEITRATIPGVESIEDWATMVMHEYFHGFQLRHPQFLERYENAILGLPPQDTLKRLYANDELFRRSVDDENEALLAALGSTDRGEIAAQIETFFELRKVRRERIKSLSGFDPTELEQLYEMMEGTARYAEHALSGELELIDPAAPMPEWLWRTDRSTWFYASGFNMARLLDELDIEWRRRIFSEKELSLERILETQYEN
ncbi:MAG: hypothetical protein LBV38_00410 [Alistipes sp.]|nr:hypothetical protein [Alistipes sp.]